MAFDFPASPTVGQQFTPAGGPTWQWDGTVWALAPGISVATAQSYNRIVNPAMQHSQEWGNTGTANLGNLNFYMADQWVALSVTSPGLANAQRVAAVTPKGSANRCRITVATAKAALAAGDYIAFRQPIEGIRVADFLWGSASAKQVVLRFGFKGPAGTYSVSLFNSATNRSYIANFTVSAGQANTDTEQVMVIPGDVTGTWLADNGVGIYLGVTLATSTTFQGAAGWQAALAMGTAATSNGMATAGNVFELFDVGLYLDPNNTGVPPPWVTPDFASELFACKRYWQQAWTMWSGNTTTGVTYFAPANLPAALRTTPTLSGTNAGAVSFPATSGGFTYVGSTTMGALYEGRVANATANGCHFESAVTANARM